MTPAERGPHRLQHQAGRRLELKSSQLDLEPTGLDTRITEQLVDHAAEPGNIAFDDGQRVLLGRREVAQKTRVQRFGISTDRGQRRAQLVADVGEQVAFDLVELLQLPVHPVEPRIRSFEVGDGARKQAGHVVECGPEHFELVSRVQIDAVLEAAACQFAGTADQVFDRTQALARQHHRKSDTEGQTKKAEQENPPEKFTECQAQAPVVEMEKDRILVPTPLFDIGHHHQILAIRQIAFPPGFDRKTPHRGGQADPIDLGQRRAGIFEVEFCGPPQLLHFDVVNGQLFEVGIEAGDIGHQLLEFAVSAFEVGQVGHADLFGRQGAISAGAGLDFVLQVAAAEEKKHRRLGQEHQRDQRRNGNHETTPDARPTPQFFEVGERLTATRGVRSRRLAFFVVHQRQLISKAKMRPSRRGSQASS